MRYQKQRGGIYCQLNDKFGLIGAEEEDGEGDDAMRELTIVPKDSGSCTSTCHVY